MPDFHYSERDDQVFPELFDNRPACRKCGGTGRFIARGSGRDCGECFSCGGTGKWGQPKQAVLNGPAIQGGESIPLPKTLHLVLEKQIRLHLGICKIVDTQAGKICLVSPMFGAGYYGTFERDGTFRPTKQCTQQMKDILLDVEARGIEAVKAIGKLNGICCVCGRKLTDEYSIANGIGPICSGRFA